MMADTITAAMSTKAEAPPLQPIDLAAEDAADTIRHLLEYLSAYIRENHRLCDIIADQDRSIEIYRRLIADFERQKGDGK